MPTLEASIDARKAQQGARQFEDATNRMGREARTTGREVAALESRVNVFGSVARRASLAVSGLFGSIAAVAATRQALVTLGSFEETMLTLEGVTGATAQTMDRLSETARRMGSTTKFSASEAGDGLLFLARAGFSAEQAMQALPATLNLAIAANADLATSADIASNVVAQFGLTAEDTARVVDSLVNTSNNSNTNLLQLAEAMKVVGPLAAGLGISVETTAAAIGTLGNSGIQASLAGTNLRNIISTLIEDSADLSKNLAELGLEFEDVSLNTNTLEEAFVTLRNAGLDATNVLSVFDKRNASAAITLLNYAETIGDLTTVQEENIGASQKMAELMASGLAGAVKTFGSTVQELYLKLGDRGLGGAAKAVVETGTSTVRMLGGFADESDRANLAAQTLSAGVQFLGVTTGAFIAMKLAEVLLGVGSAAGTATNAVRVLWVTMAANPVAAVAIAVGAAATSFLVMRDNARDTAVEISSTRREFAALIEQLKDGSTVHARFTEAQRRGDAQGQADAIEDQVRALRSLQVEITRAEQLGQSTVSRRDLGQALGYDSTPRVNSHGILRTEDFSPSGVLGDMTGLSALRKSGGVFSKAPLQATQAREIIDAQVDALLAKVRELREGLSTKSDTHVVSRESVASIDEATEALVSFRAALQEERDLAGATTAEADNYKKTREAIVIALQQENGERLSTLASLAKEIFLTRQAVDAAEKQAEARERASEATAAIEQMTQALQEQASVASLSAEARREELTIMRAQAIATEGGIELTDAHTAAIRGHLQAINQANEARRAAAELKAEEERQARLKEREQEQLERARESFSQFLADLDFEATLIGKTNDERSRTVALRQADALAQRAQIDDWPDRRAALEEEIALMQKASERERDRERVSEQASTTIARGVEDTILAFDKWNDTLKDVLLTLERLVLRELVTGPLQGGISSILRDILPGAAGAAGAAAGGGTSSARGNLIQTGGGVRAMAQGAIINAPTMIDGKHLAGEAGAEIGIAPLKRGKGGEIGVSVEGLSSGGDTYNFHFHGVSDIDSFRRSKTQIVGELSRAVGSARRR